MTSTTTSLDGKVAVVTGAARGIGRETARTLAEYGAHVVVSDVSEEGGRETVEYVGGDRATFVAADVAELAAMENLVARTLEIYGRIDVAHNNAGIDLFGINLADITAKQFQRVLDVNVTGVFNSMKAQIPAMLAGGGGSIINMSSALGEVALAGQSVYVASKHAVLGLTKAVALEYSSRGIRANAVLPGVIRTPIIEQIESDHPGFMDQLVQYHPVGRLGTPRDVAEVVAWLASDAAAFVTGGSFPVDGGYLAH